MVVVHTVPYAVFRLVLFSLTEARAETEVGWVRGEEGEKGAGIHRRGLRMAAGDRGREQWQVRQPVSQKAREAASSFSTTQFHLMVHSASRVISIPSLQPVSHLNKYFFLPHW